jgi:hypothetical protein
MAARINWRINKPDGDFIERSVVQVGGWVRVVEVWWGQWCGGVVVWWGQWCGGVVCVSEGQCALSVLHSVLGL